MISIKTWSGNACARITDLTNAGKRGKKCRVIRFRGIDNHWRTSTPETDDSYQLTCRVLHRLNQASPDEQFDSLRAELVTMGVAVGDRFSEQHAQVVIFEEEIRGVDAPQPNLTAGVDGKWYAAASETGISLGALDDVNEWREITHNQTGPAAYAIAKKCWQQVESSKTLHEAATILRNNGAKLHGYCGMD
jgi:hypothetical protein